MDQSNQNDFSQKDHGDSLVTTEFPSSLSRMSEGNKLVLMVGVVIFALCVVGGVGYFIYMQKDESFANDLKSDASDSKVVNVGGIVGSSCAESYEKLLKANEFDFEANCDIAGIRTGEFSQEDIKKQTNSMVLIFDASGSMAATINGKRKIDIARDSAKGFIDKVAGDKNFSLSILVYGHKGGNSASQKAVSCGGIDEVYYMGEVNSSIAKKKLDSLDAVGWTPISSSIQKASEILQKNVSDKKFILLVSDGEETCGGDPVTAVKNLKNSNITTNVIGFDVVGKEEQQLKNIADAGGGEYLGVKNAQDMDSVFEKNKQMLSTAEFKIGRTIEQIYDVSNIIYDYNSCLSILKKQEISMMLDIHASKLAGEKCEDYSDKQYRYRYDEILRGIEKNYESKKPSLDQLKL